MMLTKQLIYLFMAALLINSCVDSPEFPDTPNIEFISFTEQSDGSAIITIEFQDGDGNIGEFMYDPPIVNNLFLDYYRKNDEGVYKDTAESGKAYYAIPLDYSKPSLTPLGQNKVLQGEIQIKIDNPWFDPGANKDDTIKYNIQLHDRDSNESNIVTTGPIPIP